MGHSRKLPKSVGESTFEKFPEGLRQELCDILPLALSDLSFLSFQSPLSRPKCLLQLLPVLRRSRTWLDSSAQVRFPLAASFYSSRVPLALAHKVRPGTQPHTDRLNRLCWYRRAGHLPPRTTPMTPDVYTTRLLTLYTRWTPSPSD